MLCELRFPLTPAMIESLDSGLASGNQSFELYWEGIYQINKASAKIYFYKKIESDEYVALRYDASTQASTYPFEERKNSFILKDGKGITFREAYNLLQGRPIFKDFLTNSQVSYSAWLQLDFSARDISGNYVEVKYPGRPRFDLDKAVRMYPILELEDENDANELIWSLQRGDRVKVSFRKRRKIEKVLIEVNVKEKLLTIIPMHVLDVKKIGKNNSDEDMESEVEEPME